MNEHAGPACALSGLIVGIFAILLHDPSLTPPAPRPVGNQAGPASPPVERPTANAIAIAIASQAPRPVAIVPQPQPAVEPPIVPPKAAVPLIRRPAEPEPEPAPEPRPAPAVAASPVEIPKRRTPPPGPRPSFAVVEPGERLADVAARVYGSEDAAEALWKANRDQVARIDSPLDRGTLLRAP